MLRTFVLFVVIAFSCNETVNEGHSGEQKQLIGITDTLNNNGSLLINSPTDSLLINKIVSTIEYTEKNIKLFKVVKIDIQGSSEGGEAILYLNSSDTVKVEANFYGETGKSEHVFYLERHNIIGYFSKLITYKEPINSERKVQIEKIVLERIILSDNKILEWKKDDELQREGIAQKASTINELFSQIQKLSNQ